MRKWIILAIILLSQMAVMSPKFAVKASTPWMLLVDGGEAGRIARIKDALSLAGYVEGVDYITIAEADVTAELLMAYEIVLWSELGECEAPSSNSQDAIAQYLESGGNLIIFGEDIGYEIGYTSWYQTYLKASYKADSAGTSSVIGVPGTGFEGLFLTLDPGTAETYWPDVIEPLDGAVKILEYSGGSYDGYGAGIMYLGEYGLIYFSFNIDAISSLSDLAELLRRCISALCPPARIEVPEASKPGIVPVKVEVCEEGIFNLTILLDNTKVFSENVTSPKTLTINVNVTQLGYHNVTANLYSNGTLVGQVIKKFYIDGTPPSLNVDISNGSIIKAGKKIGFEVSDDYKVDVVEVYLNNTLVKTIEIGADYYSDRIEIEANISGNYILKFVAYDLAGWTNSTSAYVYIDTILPVVNITVENAMKKTGYRTYVPEEVAKVNVTVADDVKVSTIIIYINGNVSKVIKNITMFTEILDVNVSSSSVKLDVFANDTVNNTVWAEIAISLDTTPPALDIVEPANGTVVKSGGAIISWVAFDDKELYKIVVQVNGSVVAELPPGTNGFYFKPGKNGIYVIRIIAYDAAGNYDEEVIIVKFNATEYGSVGVEAHFALPLFYIAVGSAIAIVAVIAYALVFRRRKVPEEEMNEEDLRELLGEI